MVEYGRQAVHISMGLLTILLRFLTKLQALSVCVLALFAGFFLLRPKGLLGVGFNVMAREEDKEFGYLIGPLIYIVTTTLCLAILPLGFGGAAMMIMAFGDGFSNIIGSKWGKHRNPLDRQKTLEGSFAFFAFAFIASSFIMWFVGKPVLPLTIVFLLAAKGSFMGMLVESLPWIKWREKRRGFLWRIILDDNLFVPLISGLTILLAYSILI
jgi:dolichol kinase